MQQFNLVHSLATKVYPADSFMLTKLKIQKLPIYVKAVFHQVDMGLINDCNKLSFDVLQVAELISNKQPISIQINAILLQAKSAFYQQNTQKGRDLMKKAREVAMAVLKDDDDENYCIFLMDFINMNIDFCANEEYEIDMLLKVHEELVEVKKKLDSRGKLFEGFSDDKAVKIESIKYELLKKTKRRE
jgi:hypothetical protein